MQYSPHQHVPIKFGAKRQYAIEPDSTTPLDEKGKKYVQQVVGCLLFYARAIDSTILPALNTIGSEQSKPTQNTKQKCARLLDYVATYQYAFLRFHSSNMQLIVDSDAAYLVLPGAKSRIAGYFRMGDESFSGNCPDSTRRAPNASILVECKTLRHVVASAAEAEASGLYHNAQTILPIRTLLEALGHPQKPTIIKSDNSTAIGFVEKTIQMKKSKSWDMRLCWLRDRELQSQFKVFWERGSKNDADYFTKHHPIKYHRSIRSTYVHDRVQ